MSAISAQFAIAATLAGASRSSAKPNSSVPAATVTTAEKAKAASMTPGMAPTSRSCSSSEISRALTSAIGAVMTKESAKL